MVQEDVRSVVPGLTELYWFFFLVKASVEDSVNCLPQWPLLFFARYLHHND